MKMRTLPSVGPVCEEHHVNKHSMFDFPPETKSVIFGMGCFWGVERLFWKQEGVYSTQAGYAGGKKPNPTYEETCRGGKDQHAEVVRVIYYPQQISLEKLLQTFWTSHDPTQGDRQGNDHGPQYRSAIFVNNEQELDLARRTRDIFQSELAKTNINRPITTEIKIETTFFYAEDYHQQYLSKNPWGYCGLKGTGASCPL